MSVARTLFRKGASFTNAVVFQFASMNLDFELSLYRKYYGGHISLYFLVVSYVAMALGGLAVELVFSAFGWVPAHRPAAILPTLVGWNSTTWVDLAFLALITILAWRFLSTGGLDMLRAMSNPGKADQHRHEMHDPVCGMPVGPATTPEKVQYRGNRLRLLLGRLPLDLREGSGALCRRPCRPCRRRTQARPPLRRGERHTGGAPACAGGTVDGRTPDGRGVRYTPPAAHIEPRQRRRAFAGAGRKFLNCRTVAIPDLVTGLTPVPTTS